MTGWSLYGTYNFYRDETLTIRLEENWGSQGVVYVGYDQDDYPVETTRENSCEGTATQAPAWGPRVDTLYQNDVRVNFSFSSYLIPSLHFRHHYVKWNEDAYAEVHFADGVNAQLSFPNYQSLLNWMLLNDGTLIAARVDSIYRGTSHVDILPLTNDGGEETPPEGDN